MQLLELLVLGRRPYLTMWLCIALHVLKDVNGWTQGEIKVVHVVDC